MLMSMALSARWGGSLKKKNRKGIRRHVLNYLMVGVVKRGVSRSTDSLLLFLVFRLPGGLNKNAPQALKPPFPYHRESGAFLMNSGGRVLKDSDREGTSSSPGPTPMAPPAAAYSSSLGGVSSGVGSSGATSSAGDSLSSPPIK